QGIEPDEVVEAEDPEDLAPYLLWWRPIRHMRVGLDVLALEEVLCYLDELREEPDGVYGMDSVRAVQRLQRRFGLPVTGIVDEDTATALNEAVLDTAAGQARDTQLERALELLKSAL
ncbi:MAG: peptidoglycan-binding domain-containing protein, partial [Bacillota bacterium]|nr:peptidoglycan-binding domain-containing protein [Bacillota bacterium]